MANKKRQEEIRKQYQQKAKQQQYEKATKHLFIFPWVALGVSILVLLLMFVTFADVYNKAPEVGVEVKVSGWSFVMSGLTGNFTSADKIYGDMAMPFYYYAGEWCESVATFALLAVIAMIINIVLQVVAAIKKLHILNLASSILSVLAAVFLIICYVKGLGMKNGYILSIYCSGNPLCSIRSYAILPAIISLGGAVASGIAIVEYFIAAKLLK